MFIVFNYVVIPSEKGIWIVATAIAVARPFKLILGRGRRELKRLAEF